MNIILDILRPIVLFFWRAAGWSSDPFPPDKKLVITGAPHTSMWDYIVALFAAYEQRRRLNVTMKDSLFFPPLGWILRLLGAVPIDRGKSVNFVQQVAQRFAEVDRMVMIFTPEATRSYTEYWKTGFYWAAVEADVRILCAAINWKEKHIYFGLVFKPSGDIEADFEAIRAYQTEHGYGKYPENAGKVQLRPQEEPSQDDAPAETVAS